MDLPRYFVVGMRPVKFVATPSGGMAVLQMNWDTGVFEYGMEYLSRALSNSPEVDVLSEDEFIRNVEALRGRLGNADGPIQALYDVINATEDIAKQEGRRLSDEEKALIAALRRKTYELFEAAHPYQFQP